MPLTPLIDSAIPQQNLELIRDRIGGILLCEIQNQHDNFDLPDTLTPSNVWIERFVDVDDEEFPFMAVRLHDGTYLDKDGMPTKDSGGQSVGTYGYCVDIVTGRASTDTVGGDEQATYDLHRMIGMVRAIIDDTRYLSLGFDNKADGINIRNVHVKNFLINIPQNTINTTDFIWGKIYVEVVCTEEVALPQPVDMQFAGVTVGLKNSTRGFYWELLQKKITIVTTGATLTDAFFSNPINEIVVVDANNNVLNTYALTTDFTKTGTTITAMTFTFTSGQIIIART